MVQISQCCDSQATGELHEGANDSTFGKCADCGDYTFFNEEIAPTNLIEEPAKTSAMKALLSETSQETLLLIGPKCHLPEEVYTTFNPAVISWVAERVGITSRDGVDQALADGHFVINVADEIYNDAHVKMPVEPGTGTVLNTLNILADTMERVLSTTNQKIVVHCAMGMERSVLAVIWLMASQWRMHIDQAYNQIKKHRPIALDRTNWITM